MRLCVGTVFCCVFESFWGGSTEELPETTSLREELTMVGMRRAARWLGALVFGLCMALAPGSAHAAFITGGTTNPVKPGAGNASGFVDVQVYSFNGVNYGTGNAAADAFSLGLAGAGAG